MSEKIKGSDDIERTIDEWTLFIEERIFHVSDDGQLDEEITKTKWDARYYFQCEEEGMCADIDFPALSHYVGDSVFDFFRLALDDAAARGSNVERKLEILSSHMMSLADKLTSKTDFQVHDVGRALLRFIDERGELPDQPKDLEAFTEKNPDIEQIPRRRISEHLAEYRLEEVVIGNKRKKRTR